MASTDETRGNEIRFIAGKYAGKSGWLIVGEDGDDEITPVIVNLKRKGLKKTYVKTDSVKKKSGKAPTSYAEAAMVQCPDIEKNLVAVSRQMAKCDISKDTEGFKKLVLDQLKDAMLRQTRRGSKAVYRKILWEQSS